MNPVPDVSIIIVSWNVRQHVLECIASIFADIEGPSVEVLLVDNASTDGTAAAVADRFPGVSIIANQRNVGFPRANNQALAEARGRHVLFLNPDTEVRPGTLGACIAALDADPTLGAVGCRIEHPDGRIQYEGARRLYRFRHLVYELLYLHQLFPQNRVFGEHLMGDWDHRGDRDVEALSGAFLMIPRRLAIELNGLPADLFMYHEDLSFCLRIARAGRRLHYLGTPSIVHYGGQSAKRSPARLRLLEAEAKYRFIREVDGPVWGALARPLLALRALIRLGASIVAVPLPRSWKARYPRALDWRSYSLQLLWCVAPRAARQLMPRAPLTVSTDSAAPEPGR